MPTGELSPVYGHYIMIIANEMKKCMILLNFNSILSGENNKSIKDIENALNLNDANNFNLNSNNLNKSPAPKKESLK